MRVVWVRYVCDGCPVSCRARAGGWRNRGGVGGRGGRGSEQKRYSLPALSCLASPPAPHPTHTHTPPRTRPSMTTTAPAATTPAARAATALTVRRARGEGREKRQPKKKARRGGGDWCESSLPLLSPRSRTSTFSTHLSRSATSLCPSSTPSCTGEFGGGRRARIARRAGAALPPSPPPSRRRSRREKKRSARSPALAPPSPTRPTHTRHPPLAPHTHT